ncbi:MAG: TonB-dependent receptor [Synechococcus sp. ARS1019]|nr:TonB-dependent receptor [Synechococcus sp. ARS1019]|tara:strand:- start:316 stop:786 length:471 start_codon:yes stop_codon:yes gene_type:complete
MGNRSTLMASMLAVAVAGVASTVPVRAETSVEISLKNRYLTLLDDGKVIGKYPVAIGAPESPTVPGQFAVTKMDEAPVYHKKGKVIAPGPKNPVGVRYVAYVQIGTGEYAIHGTAWPNWVRLRSAVSLGCIRMLNNDVIQVFNRIKVGTPVLVTSN